MVNPSNDPPYESSAPWTARDAFLRSPGEMGRRIADFDWSLTVLGPIESWNDNLKTSLSLMLNSQHPMWIGWGDEATFFYNDAYIDVLSLAKHPNALGRPAETVWAEIWDFCGPLARKVFEQGEATFVDDVRLFMDRGTYVEETYYSFSYSPITDTTGKVSGLFCPSADVSSKILNARRLKTLSDLSANALGERVTETACASAAATLAANPDDIPFAALYLYKPDRHALVLEQAVRIAPGSDACPAIVHLKQLDDGILAARIRQAMQRGGPWTIPSGDLTGLPIGLADQPLREIMLLPMTTPDPERPIGLLIAGVNPARLLDTDYRTFFDLLVDQIDSAISNARIAEEQHQQVEALAELDRAKTAFFSNVSHEFRTPLTLLLAPLNDALLASHDDTDEELHERLLLMQRNALRLQKLVNTLLDFSRTQAGRMDVAFAPVDLAAFTADLASGFRSLIEGAGVALRVECPALSRPVFVDSMMWEKIVLNLLSNAFKFTFEGSITISLREDGEMVRLSVKDTGTGVPEHALPRLFERFHRVEGARSRTHEGSGIGLALVKDLVALHGGTITADSVVEQGTEFIVLIPHSQEVSLAEQVHAMPLAQTQRALAESYMSEAAGWIDAPRAQDADATRASQTAKKSIAGGGKILVVDDNPDMAGYLKRLLDEHFAVETAVNGRAALEKIDLDLPDVVISDVMMPELDGFGLIKALKKNPRTRALPVILLSARAGEEARVEGLQSGASDYLVKPFSSQELLARVDSQIQRAKALAVEAKSYHRMASIFEQMPVGIAILRGRELVYELANPAYLELINNRPVLGLTLRQAVPELEGQGIFELLETVYNNDTPFLATAYKIDVRRGPDSTLTECYFDIVWQPLHDLDGKVDAIAVVCTDVTESTRAGQTAELASRTKDEFLAMLGHELRNPLAPITIALEIMRMRGGNAMSRERAIIERQTQHMIRLVDDLLDVSRIAQGKFQLKLEQMELNTVAARAVELASPLMEERRHIFKANVASTGLGVNADLARLSQVLANLLTNAAKYTDPQGTIEMRARAENGEVVIEVEDTGIGITPQSLPFIFEKFVQERQNIDRARGGIGLGLAIAKTITEMHGGSITATSPGMGLGSIFTLRLPLVQIASQPHTGDPDVSQPIDPGSPHARRRVLVVDDNLDIVAMFEEILRLEGYEVKSTTDPVAAIKLAAEFVPQIALLDIGLPGMDGYELVLELKKFPQLEETRFIAVTGYGQAADRQRSHDVGFVAHLVKPVDMERLRAILKESEGKVPVA